MRENFEEGRPQPEDEQPIEELIEELEHRDEQDEQPIEELIAELEHGDEQDEQPIEDLIAELEHRDEQDEELQNQDRAFQQFVDEQDEQDEELQNQDRAFQQFVLEGLLASIFTWQTIKRLSPNFAVTLEFIEEISSFTFFKIPEVCFYTLLVCIAKQLQNELAIRLLSYVIEAEPPSNFNFFNKSSLMFDSIKSEAHQERARLHIRAGNKETALLDLKEFSRLDSSYKGFYKAQIRKTGYQLNQYETGIEDLTMMIMLNEDDSWAYEQRASLYNKTKNYKAAIKDANEAIHLLCLSSYLDSSTQSRINAQIDLYKNIPTSSLDKEDVQTMTQGYDKIIVVLPDNAVDCYEEKAKLYLQINNVKQALENYRKIIDLDPYAFVPPEFLSAEFEKKYIQIENGEIRSKVYSELSTRLLTKNLGFSLKFFAEMILSLSKMGKLNKVKIYLPQPKTFDKNDINEYGIDFYEGALKFLMENNYFEEIIAILDTFFSNAHVLETSDAYQKPETNSNVISFQGIEALLKDLMSKVNHISPAGLDKLQELRTKNAETAFQYTKSYIEGKITSLRERRNNLENFFKENPKGISVIEATKKVYRDMNLEKGLKKIVILAKLAKRYKETTDYCDFILDYANSPSEKAEYTFIKIEALSAMGNYKKVLSVANYFIKTSGEELTRFSKPLQKSCIAKIYHLRASAKAMICEESPWVDYRTAYHLDPDAVKYLPVLINEKFPLVERKIDWFDRVLCPLGDSAINHMQSSPSYFGELKDGRFVRYEGVAELTKTIGFFKSHQCQPGIFSSANPSIASGAQDFCPAGNNSLANV
jgi:tetratricopeptide (TPR) repeat protein